MRFPVATTVLFLVIAITLAQNIKSDKENRDDRETKTKGKKPTKEENGGPSEEEMKKFEKYEHPHAVDFFSTLMNDILRHEFEVVVYINKGDEDCYYEECEEGSELHGRFECESPAGIRSNGKVQASIRYPNGTIADKVEKPAKRGELNVMCTSDGGYGFCIDNTADSSGSKRVDIHLSVMHHNEIPEYHKNEQQEPNAIYSVYHQLYQVTKNLLRVRQSVKHSKAMLGRDWAMTTENYDMVAEISIAIILIIILLSYGQVYYLKQMFAINTSSMKGATMRM